MMDLYRNGSMRNGSYLDGFQSDYLGGKAKLKAAPHRNTSAKLVAALTIPLNISEVCEHETIDFEQKKSDNAKMIKLKKELYDEVLKFQGKTFGTETLSELLKMKSKWDLKGPNRAKLSGAPMSYHLSELLTATMTRGLASLAQPTISSTLEGSKWALQTEGDLVYILDDDMIPGRRKLEILSHVAGTEKYKNSVLGSIGRILPFRQKDFTFPSYRKFGIKEAGLYLPDPAYDILVEKFLVLVYRARKNSVYRGSFHLHDCEDLHLSYLLQKYRGAGSFVLPVDPKDKETWGDSEHRLAYVSETTVIFKDIVQVRDDQWWATLTSGYITQWASMNPQKIDVFLYAHSLEEVSALSPLLEKFRSTVGKKAYIAVSGGRYCPCEDAAAALKWPKSVCKERRFKIFDLGVGTLSRVSDSEVPVVQAVYASMKGLIKMHNPSVVIAVSDIDPSVKKALKMATETSVNASALVLLPRASVPKVLWMADLRSTALPSKFTTRISIVFLIS
ncbi:hypothetical protein Ancab_008287 [Ancistrocladus abbreviatus]